MAHSDPELKRPGLKTVADKKFQFLDEEERRRDPASYLHSVRSNARKYRVERHIRADSISKGQLRKLDKASGYARVAGSNWKVLDAASFSGPENRAAVKQSPTIMGSKQSGKWL